MPAPVAAGRTTQRGEKMKKQTYDPEERTALFGEVIIDFAKMLPVLGQIFCDLRRNSFDIHLEGSNNDS